MSLPKNIPTAAAMALALAAASGLSGCGKQQFSVSELTQKQEAPGEFFIQPKVDILIVEDDTGSMSLALNDVRTQAQAFLGELESKGWNYHLAAAPLTTRQAFNQVTAAKYDTNYGALWVPPFPGATPADMTGSVASWAFRFPSEYSEFVEINSSAILNGVEPGLDTIRWVLYNDKSRTPNTNFLREDAMLVILTVGNGQDTSGIIYCTRADGVQYACGTQSGCIQSSDGQSVPCDITYYQNELRALKSDPRMVRFYADVSQYQWNTPSCMGGYAYAGTRYMDTAIALNGKSFDICTQPMTAVFDSLEADLESQKLLYRTRYLFLSQQPDPATIKVTVYRNGDPNQAQVIPMDPTNGWTYPDQQPMTAFAIDFPWEMNQQTGYAIELHGSAKLFGDDRADVSFKPFGVRDSGT